MHELNKYPSFHGVVVEDPLLTNAAVVSAEPCSCIPGWEERT